MPTIKSSLPIVVRLPSPGPKAKLQNSIHKINDAMQRLWRTRSRSKNASAAGPDIVPGWNSNLSVSKYDSQSTTYVLLKTGLASSLGRQLDVLLDGILERVQALQQRQAIELAQVLAREEQEDLRQTKLWHHKLLEQEEEMQLESYRLFWMGVEVERHANERRREKEKERLEKERLEQDRLEKEERQANEEKTTREAEEQGMREDKASGKDKDHGREQKQQAQFDSSDGESSTPSSTTILSEHSGVSSQPGRVATDEQVLEAQTWVRRRTPLAGRFAIKARLQALGLQVSEKRLKRLTCSGEAARKNMIEMLDSRAEMVIMAEKLATCANGNGWFKIQMLRAYTKEREGMREALKRAKIARRKVKRIDAELAEVRAEIQLTMRMNSGCAPPDARVQIILLPEFEDDNSFEWKLWFSKDGSESEPFSPEFWQEWMRTNDLLE